jgi:hypothetical protein
MVNMIGNESSDICRSNIKIGHVRKALADGGRACVQLVKRSRTICVVILTSPFSKGRLVLASYVNNMNIHEYREYEYNHYSYSFYSPKLVFIFVLFMNIHIIHIHSGALVQPSGR